MIERRKKGNMLALIAAVVAGIVIFMLLFVMAYMRIVGSSAEQKTAIEAAALAAARDISKIVINTPEFGYVGLSDSAPNGTVTTATDTFYTPVHSINTLIGTARLDSIIADSLGVPEFQELALMDLASAKTRATQLVAVIDASILPSGTASDKDGNTLTPYISAETAYNQNQIRMTGSSNYVAGSMKLDLGAIQNGSATNIPVPKPAGIDFSLNNTNTVAGYYKSYTNLPFNGQDYVFAGIGGAIKLIDPNLWRPDITSLPYCHRTVIRAEAVQNMHGQNRTDTLKAVACAQPASIYDPKPAPGALTVSFPDGMPNGANQLNIPYDLYGANLSDANDPSDMYRADSGDYPTDAGSNISFDPAWPVASDSNQLAASSIKIAIYDWMKRAGTKADVSSILGMHNTPFDPQGPDVPWYSLGNIPAGIVHIYRFDTDGIVSYQSLPVKPQPWYVVGHDQTFIECFDAYQNAAIPFKLTGIALPSPTFSWPYSAIGEITFTDSYDVFVRIYGRRPGTMNGGKHAGEPMDNAIVAMKRNSRPVVSLSRGKASFDTTWIADRGPNKKWWKKGQAGTPGGAAGFIGAPPGITGRDDFPSTNTGAIDTNPVMFEKYDDVGGGIRPSYQTNGSAADIRFRRLLTIEDDQALKSAEYAFVGLK